MANLNIKMTDAEIAKLDYFEKAQLYHNVYYKETFFNIPTALRSFYTADEGLSLVKATISGSRIKDPYEIAKLIKSLSPSTPQTHQEIYTRALYLANVCDTSVEKILRSGIFNTKDFIPKLDEEAIQSVLKNKTTGALVPLKQSEYEPSEDDDPTPSPTPTPSVEEDKIYFSIQNGDIICDTPYQDIIAKLPKIPAAELILDAANNYQNVLNISCGYNETNSIIDFNFIQMYDTTIKFFTIHYGLNDISIEENIVNINGNI